MDNRPKWCKQIEQRAKNMDSKMPDARQCEKRFINMLNKNPIMRKIIEPIFDIGSFIFTEVVFEVVILSKTADYDPLKIILTANIDPP